MKWYAEIDETGFCFHTTQNELPLSEKILLTDENMFGKIWTGTEWIENKSEEPTIFELSQLDRIESMISKSQEQITQEARDAYTLELINSGII